MEETDFKTMNNSGIKLIKRQIPQKLEHELDEVGNDNEK